MKFDENYSYIGFKMTDSGKIVQLRKENYISAKDFRTLRDNYTKSKIKYEQMKANSDFKKLKKRYGG